MQVKEFVLDMPHTHEVMFGLEISRRAGMKPLEKVVGKDPWEREKLRHEMQREREKLRAEGKWGRDGNEALEGKLREKMMEKMREKRRQMARSGRDEL